MSEMNKIERPYQDGSWHWVRYEGLHEVYGAPAMYKANCDAWYSFQFSGIPTRQVEVLGPCVNGSLPVGVPDGYAVVPVEPTRDMIDAANSARGWVETDTTSRGCYRAMLAAAPTVKAEQVDVCDTCHGQGEVYSGHDQHFHYFDFQPPEPIMDVCPECGGEEAPSLPAAGSAVEEVEPIGHAWINRYNQAVDHVAPFPPTDGGVSYGERLMTVAQHERIVAALSAQQSAPELVSVPKQVAVYANELASMALNGAGHDSIIRTAQALRALLASHAEGGKV